MRINRSVSLMALSILFVSLFVFYGGHSAWAAAKYNWKFAHEELQGGFMDEVAREFANRLAQKSDGDIKVDIYPSGTLGTSEDLVELVQNGAIQFNWADAGHLGSQVTEVQALLLHYIFPQDMKIVEKVMRDGSFKQILGTHDSAKKTLNRWPTFQRDGRFGRPTNPFKDPRISMVLKCAP